ncbi:MAG: DUF58 domain-containing protein [Dehalococcoidia bacterium]
MLLRNAWLPVGVAILVIGLIATSGPVVALGSFVVAVGGLARYWTRRSLERVELERMLPESRAFPGEELRLTYRLTNRKALPLPRVEMRDQLPQLLTPESLDLPRSGAPESNVYTHTTHLGWHERTTWSLDLPCPERGYFRIGPARLQSGDAFGLFTSRREETTTAGVVVYPRTLSLPDLGLPAARPLGERKGRERIFEDPLRIAGLRDYEPGDPIRRIDWKATARRGTMQSRVYEPSTTQQLLVALNVDTLEHTWQGFIPEQLEAAIVVAASLARWATDERYAVGLIANASLSESDRPIAIAPGRAPDQLSRILEALGGVQPMTVVTLAEQLERHSHALPLGSTLAVVTSLMPEPLAAVLRRLRASRQQLVVLAMVDDDWSPLLGDVPVQRVDRLAVATEEAPAR